MQQVLPTNLDRTSAQVLGFDADAYVNSVPSTLHQRLNIPQNFNSGDYLAGNLAKPQEKKKNKIPSAIAAIAVTVGGAVLGYLGLKKKMPKLETIKKSIKPFFENICISAANFAEKIKGKFKNKP